jgi:arylsulfatase
MNLTTQGRNLLLLPAHGLRVLALPFDHETTDVLIGSYLSEGAAREDYRSALDSGVYLHGAIMVSKDLDGTVSVEVSDHLVKEAAQGLGTLGFLSGLLFPPLLPVTTGVGATMGGVVGGAMHLLAGSKVKDQAAETIPLGCAALILAYPRASAGGVDAAVHRAVGRVTAEAEGHHVQALRDALAGAQLEMAAAQA